MKNIFISAATDMHCLTIPLAIMGCKESRLINFVTLVDGPTFGRQWKSNCKRQVSECDAMIVILSQFSVTSATQRTCVRYAKKKGIPIISVYEDSNPFFMNIPDIYKDIPIEHATYDLFREWVLSW